MQADIKDTWYVIVNPVAGFGRGLGDLPHITKLIRENDIPHELVFSQHKHHVTELTVQAVNEGYRRIIVIGGDGTLHEVVNGLFIQQAAPVEDVTVAVIPVGYQNGFGVERVREYGVFASWRRRRAATRRTVRIDGQKVKVIGRIGAMETVLDVTDVRCSAGDIAQFELDPLFAKGIIREYR